MNTSSAEIVRTMGGFKSFRNSLPQDQGLNPDSGMTILRGTIIMLPNKSYCSLHHLCKIADSVKLNEASSLKMLTYLRDKDTHMQVIAFLTINQYLKELGMSGNIDSARTVVFGSQPPQGPIAKDKKLLKQRADKAIDDLVELYGALLEKKKKE